MWIRLEVTIMRDYFDKAFLNVSFSNVRLDHETTWQTTWKTF